jgi:hypothetical protein
MRELAQSVENVELRVGNGDKAKGQRNRSTNYRLTIPKL